MPGSRSEGCVAGQGGHMLGGGVGHSARVVGGEGACSAGGRGQGEEVRACSVGVARALVAVGEGTGRGYINVPGATAWRPKAIASSYQGTVSPTALLPKPQAGPDTAFPPGQGCELRGSPPASAHRALHLSPTHSHMCRCSGWTECAGCSSILSVGAPPALLPAPVQRAGSRLSPSLHPAPAGRQPQLEWVPPGSHGAQPPPSWLPHVSRLWAVSGVIFAVP